MKNSPFGAKLEKGMLGPAEKLLEKVSGILG